MPFDCGLRTGVVHGAMPMSRSKEAVSFAMKHEPLSVSHLMGSDNTLIRPAILDSGDQQVLDVFACSAFSRGDMCDRLVVAAVEGETNSDLLPVVTADLEAVGAPSDVRTFDGDPAVVKAVIDGSSSRLCSFIKR
ncbi:hypothetical protein ASD85_23540 [Rhizobium sp. Root651]|nr:hypothetical protein ASD85_23540 [Rhizobium sp. Root651]